jgi:hypothetical protein
LARTRDESAKSNWSGREAERPNKALHRTPPSGASELRR